MTDYYDFELVFSCSVGAVFGSGVPELFGRVRAIKMPTFPWITVTVLARQNNNTWEHYETEPDPEVIWKRIIDPLLAIGIPGKPPSLEGVGDTSDTSTSLTVFVRMLEESAGFGVSTYHSGFEGEHASTVRQILLSVLEVAGYRDTRPTVLVD